MTTDFRALCAAMVEAWDHLPCMYDSKGNPIGPHPFLDQSPFARARTALADETAEADTDDVLRLAAIIREVDGKHDKGAAALAEAILCHPNYGSAPAQEAVGPSDEELMALAEEYRSDGLIDLFSARDFARAVLARYSAPRPIPVSERLPGAGDCDAEGRCWLRRRHEPDGPTWRLFSPESVGCVALGLYYAEWLPAHALPTPAQEGADD